jgi:3,4-dihydroxy 2-butanone 4-phosphate synthase / GTP cyclohydrolase II
VLPTQFADFRMVSFESEIDGGEMHTALVLGDITSSKPALVRVHSQCLHGDVFGSTLCNCRNIVDESLRMIALEGRGALVYLRKFGRGCHDATMTSSMRSHEEGGESSERTLRQVGLGSQILSDLGVRNIRLLTNTPTHIPALHGFGLDIVDCVPLLSTGRMSARLGTSLEAHAFGTF